MKIEVIAEHSVAVDLVGELPVLDAGAFGLEFSRHFAANGNQVIALDPRFEAPTSYQEGIMFLRTALMESRSLAWFRNRTDDGNASHVVYTPGEGVESVAATTVADLMVRRGINRFGCVKLDIEGAEYGVLLNWPGPVANQISVEFHEHCHPRGDIVIKQIVKHLQQWYEPALHEKTLRHCIGTPNYWDSLFVLRELVT